jgi:phage terminase large subunit
MDKVTIQIPIEYRPLFESWWRNALIEGGRYSLKSHTIARYLLIEARRTKTRILCGREFQNSIADSSHQLLADLIEQFGFSDFVVTRDSIVNNQTGSDFLFRGIRHNSQSIKSIEGVDIFWGEESQAFSKESIDIITPTIRKPGSRLIWTMNRTLELDPIYEMLAMHPRDDTLHLKINYDVAEKHGWLPSEIKKEIEHDKTNNPEVYQHKWLGQPISQAEQSVISRTATMEAMRREVADDGAVEVGVDVARMGNDRSVFYKRKGLRLIEEATHNKLRLTDLADRLEKFVGFDKAILIKIDDTGVGGGLTDIMMQRGYNIRPSTSGLSPSTRISTPTGLARHGSIWRR